MARKSVIINLPIVPYNQSKHSDVVQYLEVLLTEVYAPDEGSNTEDVSQLDATRKKYLFGRKKKERLANFAIQ